MSVYFVLYFLIHNFIIYTILYLYYTIFILYILFIILNLTYTFVLIIKMNNDIFIILLKRKDVSLRQYFYGYSYIIFILATSFKLFRNMNKAFYCSSWAYISGTIFYGRQYICSRGPSTQNVTLQGRLRPVYVVWFLMLGSQMLQSDSPTKCTSNSTINLSLSFVEIYTEICLCEQIILDKLLIMKYYLWKLRKILIIVAHNFKTNL